MRTKVTITRGPDISAALGDLMNRSVLVGIPGGSTRPSEGKSKAPLDNSEIGYIMENGAPEANIPARPFLLPGIESVKGAIAAQLKKAVPLAMAGDRGAVQRALDTVGLIAQTAVRRKILDGPFEPLSERTLEARARRLAPSGKLSKAATSVQARKELKRRAAGDLASSANAKPLYDTHSLFNSVTYIVREKGPHYE